MPDRPVNTETIKLSHTSKRAVNSFRISVQYIASLLYVETNYKSGRLTFASFNSAHCTAAPIAPLRLSSSSSSPVKVMFHFCQDFLSQIPADQSRS